MKLFMDILAVHGQKLASYEVYSQVQETVLEVMYDYKDMLAHQGLLFEAVENEKKRGVCFQTDRADRIIRSALEYQKFQVRVQKGLQILELVLKSHEIPFNVDEFREKLIENPTDSE